MEKELDDSDWVINRIKAEIGLVEDQGDYVVFETDINNFKLHKLVSCLWCWGQNSHKQETRPTPQPRTNDCPAVKPNWSI